MNFIFNGPYEPQVKRVVERVFKAGGKYFIDAVAFVGVYSIYVAKLLSKACVLAVEQTL